MPRLLRAFSAVCALFLILLAVTPFLAPFATFELGQATSDAASSGSSVKAKISSDATLPVPAGAAFGPLLPVVGALSILQDSTAAARPILHLVLRL